MRVGKYYFTVTAVCTAQSSVLASIIFMFTPDWKKKDEEHAEWDKRRRSSQEQVSETRDRDEALYICLDIPTLLANFLACHLYIFYILVYLFYSSL